MKLFMCLVLMLTFGACASKETSQVPVVVKTEEVKKEEPVKTAEFGGNCGMGLCLKKIVKGDPKYSVEHKGKTYLFSSAKARDKFMKNADKNIELANKQWSVMGAEKGIN